MIKTSVGSTAVNQTAALWTNPSNVFADDGAYAVCPGGAYTVDIDLGYILPTLLVSGFDFSAIPSNATVTSVRVSKLKIGSGSAGASGLYVALTIDGTTDLCASRIVPGATMTDMATSVFWTVPVLSVSEVKGANFGVRLYPDSGARVTQNVDALELEVGYLTPLNPSSPIFVTSVYTPTSFTSAVL